MLSRRRPLFPQQQDRVWAGVRYCLTNCILLEGAYSLRLNTIGGCIMETGSFDSLARDVTVTMMEFRLRVVSPT